MLITLVFTFELPSSYKEGGMDIAMQRKTVL